MKHHAKRIVTLLLSVLMILSTISLNVFALEYGAEWEGYYQVAPTTFTDVPSSHWAYNGIMQVYQKKWFDGYPDNTFRPNDSITRAEALKVFVVFLGIDYQSVDLSDLTYSDVYPSDWYAAYIEAGKDLFPVHTNIQGKTPFNPNSPVTREDTIYALVKALGCDVGVKYPDQSVLNMFTDSSSISGALKDEFAIALQEGLVSGYEDHTIRAQAALTRAEFATLLLRGTEHGFHDRYEAKISSVTVSPASPVEIEIGESVTLSARATYTDGTNQPYSNLQPYDAENNGVISLTGTTITGLKEGTTTIKYNDSYLKKDSLTVVVKTPESNLNIKIYEYPEQTELSNVTVIGEVIDADVTTVNLTANQKDVKVKNDGSFSVNVSLEVGNNEIKFAAENKYGAKAEKTINIVRADVPVIKITDYKEKTTAKTTPVSGVVEYYDLNNISLSCNGENIGFNDDGTFTTTVDLKIGKNPFLFVAETNGGNTAEQAIVIRRYEIVVEPEEVVIKRPEKEIFSWDWMDAIPTTTQYKRVEAVLVIDDSGSLGGDYGYNTNTGFFGGGTDPEHKRLEAAREFVDNSNENSKIGIVKFDSSSEKLTPSLVKCDNNGKAQLKGLLQINNGTFDSKGTTHMYKGINDAFTLFESNDPEVMKVVIVFSDGMAHDTELHAQTILNANQNDITIYSVGLGESNSTYFEEYMKPLASNTGGAFYMTNTAVNLKNIFGEIITRIDINKDSDGDGIADFYEDTMEDENGNPMNVDKNNPDTDGDGLKDGEEIRLSFEYNADQTKVKVTAFMSSNPTKTDTDGDGVGDKDDNYPLDASNN